MTTGFKYLNIENSLGHQFENDGGRTCMANGRLTTNNKNRMRRTKAISGVNERINECIYQGSGERERDKNKLIIFDNHR